MTEFENLLVTNDFTVSKAVAGIFYAGKFLNSTSGENAEIAIGQSLGSDACLIVGYDHADNKGYLQVCGDAPYSCLEIRDGGTVKFGQAIRVGPSSNGLFLGSTADDNFHFRTHTNTPNPNITIGYGNGSGSLDSSLEYLSMNAGYINLVNANVKLTDGKELQWSDVRLYRGAPDKLQTEDTFKAFEVQIEHASSEGPALVMFNPNKTGLGNQWSIYNMTGGYGDSLQFWVYGGEGWGQRLVLTDAGQLKLPISGSSGGMVTGSGVSIEHDAEIIDINDLRLPTEDLQEKAYTTLGHGNILFKNTLSEIQGVREYPDGIYTSLFLVMVENPPPYEGEYAPILATDHGLWVEKDILTYGVLMTTSDPGKSSGGGAILMGHGYTGATSEPQFVLTDTIGGGSGADAELTVSGGVITNVTVTDGGSGYTFADVTVNTSGGSDARLAPVIEDGEIQSINVYNGGSGYDGSDTVNITNEPHDTLYLKKFGGSSAHLDLGDLTAHGHFSVGDTVTSDLNPNPDLDLGNYNNPWASVVTSSLWVKSTNTQFGVTAGDEWNGSGYDVYLHPQNPANGGICLGTANYPFKWVNASYVYTDYLNSLSTSLHLESASEKIYINDAASANTGLELGNSSNSGGVVYIDFHYGRNIGYEDYNVRLINDSDCILTFQTRTTTGGILPSSGGQYVLGSSSKDWSYVYANYLRYDVNIAQYDSLDDLALVKNHKSKKITDKQSGEEITVIDMKESFPFLLADDNHIAHEKLQGYMLGCVKALVLRVEALENQLKQNQTPD